MNRLINITNQDDRNAVAQATVELSDGELENVIGGCGGHDYHNNDDCSGNDSWSGNQGDQGGWSGGYDSHNHCCSGLLEFLGL